MIKSGIESLASSADSIDNTNDSINYAKMIETFRRYDKKRCGYLSKKQYIKFLHDMKIFQTEDFEEITFRSFVCEDSAKSSIASIGNDNSKIKSKYRSSNMKDDSEISDEDLMSSFSFSTFGITFEMARVICEAFGSGSVKSIPQSPRRKMVRRSSRQTINSETNENTTSYSQSNQSNSNETENTNINETDQALNVDPNLSNNNDENVNYTASYSQLQSNFSASTSNDNIVKFERTSSAPAKDMANSDFIPLSKKQARSKPEKNSFKTKICSLILFRGVDIDRDGKINLDEFKKIAKIVDVNLTDQDIANLYESCSPDPNNHLVSYPNVSKQLFEVFVWNNEDPYQTNLINCAPTSKLCILI